jgi:hypothetical protein
VIRLRRQPLLTEGGIAVLRGNLAPAGAIIKPAAASPHLIQHRGRALVFDSIEDLHTRIDDPELDVDANTVLVLRGCGRDRAQDELIPRGPDALLLHPGQARGGRARGRCTARLVQRRPGRSHKGDA